MILLSTLSIFFATMHGMSDETTSNKEREERLHLKVKHPIFCYRDKYDFLFDNKKRFIDNSALDEIGLISLFRYYEANLKAIEKRSRENSYEKCNGLIFSFRRSKCLERIISCKKIIEKVKALEKEMDDVLSEGHSPT